MMKNEQNRLDSDLSRGFLKVSGKRRSGEGGRVGNGANDKLKPKKPKDKPTLCSFCMKGLVTHHQEVEWLLLFVFSLQEWGWTLAHSPLAS